MTAEFEDMCIADNESGDKSRIKLFRMNNQNKIRANLQPLKLNNKKKLAQILHYSKHPEQLHIEKGSVHQRLGTKSIRLRRSLPLGSSTMSILPKKRMIRTNNYVKRPNNIQHFTRYKPNAVIKLRRLIARPSSARNLTVQVRNTGFISGRDNSNSLDVLKFKMRLNPVIQAEISAIQTEFISSPSTILPSTTITPYCTDIKLTDRFALL